MRKSYIEMIALGLIFTAIIKLVTLAPEYAKANTNINYAPGSYVNSTIDYSPTGVGERYLKKSEFDDWISTNVFGGGVVKPRPFPVFKLDMRYGYADFELKASTNNFASMNVSDMVYMYVSTTKFDFGIDDPDPYTFYSNELMPDRRKWIYAPPHTSIAGLLATNSPPGGRTDWVYFYPSTNCDVSAKDWMYEDNTNLVWAWVRSDGVDPEYNDSDPPRSVWSIIRPDSWEHERTRIPEM